MGPYFRDTVSRELSNDTISGRAGIFTSALPGVSLVLSCSAFWDLPSEHLKAL